MSYSDSNVIHNNNMLWQNAMNNWSPFNYVNTGAAFNMNNNFNWGCNNFGFANNNFGWNSSPSVWGNYSNNNTTSSSSTNETVAEQEIRYKKELETKNQERKKEVEAKQQELAEIKAEEDAWNLLSEDYAKSSAPSESLTAAAAGGAAFGVINNPRIIAHPINTYKGLKDTKAMFADVTKKGSVLNQAWKANSPVMEEAYAQMQKLASRHESKLGLFRAKISDARYRKLKTIMDEALKTGDTQKIAEATAKLKHAYVNDGILSRFWAKIRGKSVPTVTERLGETGKIAEEATKILSHGKDMTYLDALKKGGGIKNGIAMAGIEILFSVGKIKRAFSKDSETGWKQIGQTTVKATGNAVGWAAGEALGVWGAAKLGATIGTAFGPGVGTAIGAVAGLVVGSIGFWAAGKLTHWLVGDDVGDKVDAENKLKDDNGKLELLNNAIARANNNEIKDEKNLQAVQTLAAKYSAVA